MTTELTYRVEVMSERLVFLCHDLCSHAILRVR